MLDELSDISLCINIFFILCRRDKHKYSNSSQKTSSQKSKRVGKQEKN